MAGVARCIIPLLHRAPFFQRHEDLLAVRNAAVACRWNADCASGGPPEAIARAGAHAAAFSALIRASHRLDVWLGGATESDDSFPLTDGGHLPADRMFRAALTSRSCVTPHALHTHVLTASMSRPVGPVRALQLLHVRVVFLSLTI